MVLSNLCNIIPGVPVWFPNTDQKRFSLHIWRLYMVHFENSCQLGFLNFPCVRAALNIKEYGQIALIKMHIIPETQGKFSIKIPLHSAIAELLLFTPSWSSYSNTWKCLNKMHHQPIFAVIRCSGLMFNILVTDISTCGKTNILKKTLLLEMTFFQSSKTPHSLPTQYWCDLCLASRPQIPLRHNEGVRKGQLAA